jgi:K+-transporting ATPase ATPase B chain
MIPARRLERRPKARSLFDRAILTRAVRDSFLKLDPRLQAKNPVMFIVLIGAVVTTLFFFRDLVFAGGKNAGFDFAITIWLWFTVLFANFAEAVAEGRGKAQAEFLRRTKTDTQARKLVEGHLLTVGATELRAGDVVRIEAGELIPGDGDVIEGAASVDESAITGESAPVIRESGGDRSAVTGGTRVLSDHILVRITSNPGDTFLDRMIALVEGATRQKTPNEIALSILLAGLTIIFVIAVATLGPYSIYAGAVQSVTVLIALLVCLIPTTIGGLLSAIGIAGMDRVLQRNVLAMSGRAVEAAGDVDTLLLDKTGTITLGNRQATEILVAGGVSSTQAAQAAYLSSLADETPEGRSIVLLAKQDSVVASNGVVPEGSVFVPFSAYSRMSGLDLPDGSAIRKGAPDAVRAWVRTRGEMLRLPRPVRRFLAPRSSGSRARAERRCCSRATRRCWASSISKTSSSRTCASVSTACGRWESAPSWSPATIRSPPAQSRTRRVSMTSSRRPRPRRRCGSSKRSRARAGSSR